MPQLKIQLARLTVVTLMFFSIASLSQAQSPAEQTLTFGRNYGCAIDGPLRNEIQYSKWLNFLRGIREGLYSPDIFDECPQSPYVALKEAEGEEVLNSGNYRNQRNTILENITKDNLTDLPELRIRQGYGAVEYLLFAMYMCRGDRPCFESSLAEDQYMEKICPEPQLGNYRNTSPDKFELDLFKNGGNFDYLLPYLVTNCRLLERSIVEAGSTPIFNTTLRVLSGR